MFSERDQADLDRQVASFAGLCGPVRVLVPARGREAYWDAKAGSYVYV